MSLDTPTSTSHAQHNNAHDSPQQWHSNDSIPTPELPDLSRSNLLHPDTPTGNHAHHQHSFSASGGSWNLLNTSNANASINTINNNNNSDDIKLLQTEEDKKLYVKQTLEKLRKLDLSEDAWIYY